MKIEIKRQNNGNIEIKRSFPSGEIEKIITPEELEALLLYLKEHPRYYHQVSEFDKVEQAEEIANKLQAAGYNCEVIQVASREWLAQITTNYPIGMEGISKIKDLLIEPDLLVNVDLDSPCDPW